MSTGKSIRESSLPELPRVEPTPRGRGIATSADAESLPYKVILSTPETSSTSLVVVNLIAVAVGTVKVLAWATMIFFVTFGAFLAGIIKAGSAHGRRHW